VLIKHYDIKMYGGGGGVGIAPPLLNSALEDNTLHSHRHENLKLYVILSACSCKAAVLKVALISLLSLNSTKINLFSGVFQSYYK
jgi:hypothetical protein